MRKFILFIVSFSQVFALDMINPVVYDIDKIDIKEYLVSEKLDGVRGFWDGKNLYSKNQNRYDTPSEFIKDFPPFAIDGELYFDGDFEEIVSDVRSGEFKKVSLYVFEVPEQKGGLNDRLEVLKNYLKTHQNTKIKIIPQHHFKTKQEFFKFFKSVVGKGGEGVVLHKKDTPYDTKKGGNVIKYKNFYDDECKIIDVVIKDGLLSRYDCLWDNQNGLKAAKTKSTLKALQKRQEVIIKVGSGFTKAHRLNPLKKGDVITFKYYKLSKYGVPIHSVFLRQRKD